ncbi:AAA family ATPase [Actinomadura viridis]|uniref:Pilus assembly protein CpaE n=1 Tax=Actinomadura viridis TaxID=58110 RepID=A0A931GPB0_9ACTN|nr:AAA family ATPase [Actinomadura viridis]MBG6087214.1 pilus assembly protein CpaE [Actinomadura viridis]
MSIQILIGTADQELAGRLRTQIAELADVEVVGVETGSGDVLGIASSHQELDVVLIDEDITPQSGQELIREIAMRRPHVAAVLISERVDEDVLTRALEAGARGVLGRTPTLEELNSRLTSVAEWSRGMRRWLGANPGIDEIGGRRGRVVALAGAKGGTGATTLAVQLALTAAAAGRTVCLVDMDLQTGDIPTYLDMVHRRSIADLVGVADELSGTMLADALFVHDAGPHVLLAPSEGERAEDVTSLAARQILGVLRSRYEVVIVDCGAFMTEGSVSSVEMADQAVITVTPDLPCLRAAKRLAHLWERLRVRKPDQVSVVLTRQSRKNEIQPDFAARILGMPLLRTTVPPAFRALERAINNGALARVDDDGFRRAIAQLGEELGVLPIPTGPEGRGGLLRAKAGGT